MAKVLRSLAKEFNKRPELDNNPEVFAAKVAIRERVLKAISAAHVLDCYAGSGKMHKAVWSKAASYVGVDERFFFDRRTAYVCDNRLLLRAIDLEPFNVFDADAYGSPWEQLLIIARRRPVDPGERIGLVITEGSSIKMKFGSLPFAMSELAGVPADAAGVSKNQVMIVNQAIAGLAKAMGCRIVNRWQASGKTGSRVLYIGLVLEGIGGGMAAAAPRARSEFATRIRKGSAEADLSLALVA